MSSRRSKRRQPGPWIRREGWILVLILLAGAGLRWAYLAEIRSAPDFEAPGRDALYHDYWARALITGDWTPPQGKPDPEIRSTPYMRPPAYPYFLAGAYALTGGSYLGARAVQMVLGLVNVCLAFLLGRRLFGPATGLAFAALMAVYWVFIYYEGELHAPVLATLGTLTAMLFWHGWARQPTLIRALGGGVVLGLYALVRPNVLLVTPFLLAWSLWVLRRRGRARHWPRSAAVTLAGLAAMVFPVTLRNHLAAGDAVLLTTNAGINLYISHNDDATGTSSVIPEIRELAGLAGWTCFEYPDLVRGVAARLGRDPEDFPHSEASSYFLGQAVRWALDHPGRTLSSAVERALLFWGPAEVSNDEIVTFDRRASAVLRAIPIAFPMVLGLALMGTWGAVYRFRSRHGDDEESGDEAGPAAFETCVWIALFTFAYFVSVWPTVAAARYRVPILPCLLLFAAWALVRWAGLWRRRETRRALTAAVIFAAVYLVASRPWVAYAADEAAWHFNRAVAYHRLEQLPEAVESYRRALELDGADPDTRSNLGAALLAQGENRQAIQQFQAALAVRPDHAESHHNLALALSAERRLDEAARHYRQALAFRPDYPSAHRNLGQILAAGGDPRGAIHHLRRALELEPDAAVHSLLGRLLARGGDPRGALAELEAAVNLDPSSATLVNNLGNVLAMLGRLQEAASSFERSLQLDPAYLDAHRNLVRAYAALGRRDDLARAVAAASRAARAAGQEALARDFERVLGRSSRSPRPAAGKPGSRKRTSAVEQIAPRRSARSLIGLRGSRVPGSPRSGAADSPSLPDRHTRNSRRDLRSPLASCSISVHCWSRNGRHRCPASRSSWSRCTRPESRRGNSVGPCSYSSRRARC